MSSKKAKATRRRMISCFAQIVQEHISGWKIEQIADGEDVGAILKAFGVNVTPQAYTKGELIALKSSVSPF